MARLKTIIAMCASLTWWQMAVTIFFAVFISMLFAPALVAWFARRNSKKRQGP